MMFHWQNLNDLRGGGQGSGFRHGRCWWGRLNAEWCHFLRSAPGFSIRKGDGGSLHLHFGIGFMQWFLTFAGLFRMSDRDREISLRAHDGCIWIRIWGNPDDSSQDHQWVLRYVDWIRGRAKYSTEILKEQDVMIPMPEGSYPAKAKLERATWTYPRWFTTSIICADFEIPNGIPHQGKGENSWDCGDDGIWGMHCQADSIEEGIGKVVASSLTSRRRYGQTNETRGRVVMAREIAA